ncbi:MAG: hypothetical protein KKH33_12825 [Alphaproteobacteria bacterium]|nr:hypothetical protein [Alphaproteobacteria bacterium]
MERILKSGTRLSVRYTPEFAADYLQWRAEECNHQDVDWRRRTISNGHIQISKQCIFCGHVMAGPRKHSPEDINLKATDTGLAAAYEARRSEALDAIFEKHFNIQDASVLSAGMLTIYSLSTNFASRQRMCTGSS